MKKLSTPQRRSDLKLPAPIQTFWHGTVAWWDSWLEFTLITMVWFFCQLTVVLGPPATFGMYYAVHTLISSGEGVGLKGMLRGAKLYLGKSLIWGLVNLLAILIASVNLVFYYQIESPVGFAAGIMVLIAFSVWLMTQFYAVPYFMEQEDKRIWIALRNGALTTLASPIYTLVLMVPVVILILISSLFVLPIFLGAPAWIAFLGTQAMTDRLITFGKKVADPDPRDVG